MHNPKVGVLFSFIQLMAYGTAAPVIAGLAFGIAFVILVSTTLMPSTPSSTSSVSILKVDRTIINAANQLEEAQVFFLEYPNGEVKVDRTENEIEGSAVKYSFQKTYEDGNINEVRMFVGIDDATARPTGGMSADCVTSYAHSLGGIVYRSLGIDVAKDLQTTDCAK